MRRKLTSSSGLRSAIALVLLSALVAALVCIPSDGSAAPRGRGRQIRILPPGEAYYGKTYNDLAGEWWSWALQFPSAQNPVVDETGEFGHLGQEGKIWFLAGNFGGTTVRSLTVPAGKALFIPLFNWLWWTPEDFPTVEECRAMANGGINTAANLSCVIDGQAVEDIYAYRAQSPAGGFPLAIVEGSILEEWGYTPRGPEPAVADGYWLLLDPLLPGPHTIAFHSEGQGGDFTLDVTYNLIVTGTP